MTHDAGEGDVAVPTTEELSKLSPEAVQIVKWLAGLRDSGLALQALSNSTAKIVVGVLNSVIIGILRREHRDDVALELMAKETKAPKA